MDPPFGKTVRRSPDGLFDLHLEVEGGTDDFWGRYQCAWSLVEVASGRTVLRLHGDVYDETRRFGVESVEFSRDGLALETREFGGATKRIPIPGALGPSRLAAAMGDGEPPKTQ